MNRRETKAEAEEERRRGGAPTEAGWGYWDQRRCSCRLFLQKLALWGTRIELGHLRTKSWTFYQIMSLGVEKKNEPAVRGGWVCRLLLSSSILDTKLDFKV